MTAAAVTDQPPAPTAAASEHPPLAGASFAQLAAVFAALPHPAEAPRGELRGRAVALAGVQRLPGPARRALARALAALIAPVWRGKRIEAGGGTNLWLPPRLPFARFVPRRAEDGALLLDYDVPENPGPLRGVVGELRPLAPGLQLGRMDLAVAGRRRTVLWFTLGD